MKDGVYGEIQIRAQTYSQNYQRVVFLTQNRKHFTIKTPRAVSMMFLFIFQETHNQYQSKLA